MKAFNLCINGSQKVYKSYEDAKAVFDRALSIAKANQKKYDGSIVFDYMSIDEVSLLDNQIDKVLNFDVDYIEGASI